MKIIKRKLFGPTTFMNVKHFREKHLENISFELYFQKHPAGLYLCFVLNNFAIAHVVRSRRSESV